MVDVVAFLVLWLSHWYDSCPCHAQELQVGHISSWSKRNRLRERVALGGDCVMRSRRAPELAAGVMMEFIHKFLEVCASTILGELAQLGLDQESVGIILQEFSNTRRHIWFTMVVKHSYWFHEPWCLFGIGHANVGIARACARKCLRLRHKLLQTPDKAIHALTKLVLFDQRFLQQLIDFANGTDMDNLKDLVIIAAMFRFAYTSETVFQCAILCFSPLP